MISSKHFELLEVTPFARSQRISLEERDDDFGELHAIADVVSVQVFFVVVVAAIAINAANPEETPQIVEHIGAARALGHRETRSDLPSSLVAFPTEPAALADQTD